MILFYENDRFRLFIGMRIVETRSLIEIREEVLFFKEKKKKAGTTFYTLFLLYIKHMD